MKFSDKKILIIDDDRDVLKVLQMALEQSGYEALIAGGTGEAEEMLTLFRFDLILCDMNMPGESGNEFQTRMTLVHQDLPPFIFCSGMVHDLPTPPYPDGVAGYLSKPFSLNALTSAISECLTHLQYRPNI